MNGAPIRRLAAALLALAGAVACGEAPAPEDGGRDQPPAATATPWFAEVGAEAGIDFVHQRAAEVRYRFPEIMVGGGGWLDYDGDGDLDLYLVQGGDLDPALAREAGDRLYRNDGTAGFVDVTAAAGIDGTGYGSGLTAGDYDGDGDVDLYVTRVGPNALWRNDGDGTFTDVTAAAGVGHPGWGTSAAFSDLDADGDLDLFVVNYVNWSPEVELECYGGGNERNYCHPLQYNAPAADVLYRNRGDGSFADASREAGILAAFGNGLGLAVGDFDGDGATDLYVANDGMPNQLWIQTADGRFEDRALLAGCAVSGTGMSEAGMGVAAVDLEQDGDLDLFMTHLRDETNTFYLNQGEAFFEDATASLGLAAPSVSYTGFGTGFADFDADGVLDLYVVNGRVGGGQKALVPGDLYAEPNLLFRGAGELAFALASPPDGTREARVENSRAAAFGDHDGDGDLDVLVVNNGGPARLLENRAGDAGGAWLQVRVLRAAGSDALGAGVTVTAAGRTWRRRAHNAYSYCAVNDPRAHVGLGGAERVDELEVTWPDGSRAAWRGLPASRNLVVAPPHP